MARSAIELVSRRARRHGAGRMERSFDRIVSDDRRGRHASEPENESGRQRRSRRGSGRVDGAALYVLDEISLDLSGAAPALRGSPPQAGIAEVEQLVEDRRGALGVVERAFSFAWFDLDGRVHANARQVASLAGAAMCRGWRCGGARAIAPDPSYRCGRLDHREPLSFWWSVR